MSIVTTSAVSTGLVTIRKPVTPKKSRPPSDGRNLPSAQPLTVPKGSNTGAVLRLKGKGVPRRSGHGDELARLKVMLPPEPNPELEAFLSSWAAGSSYDPRRDMQP